MGDKDNTPEIVMNRFPYPQFLNDVFYAQQMETMVSMMIMFSFMYNYINTIRAVTTEKEKQLKVIKTKIIQCIGTSLYLLFRNQ